MIHNLSKITTYIETGAFNYTTGEKIIRSHATGFFVRSSDDIFLVTNWHVVSGLNPENPKDSPNKPCPTFLHIHVISKENSITRLTLPLYDKAMNPLWYENQSGYKVDIIIYRMPQESTEYFHFYEISKALDKDQIETEVSKDVFILGYPFNKSELDNQFADKNYFSFPVWKKGTIATEPNLLLNDNIILIDSLSRPGMSGAPVIISEENDVMLAGTQTNREAFDQMLNGDSSAILSLDLKHIKSKKMKSFNLLGVYSGVIGSSRLQEIALGKCWDKKLIYEIISNPKRGEMPFHKPITNEFYDEFLSTINGRIIFHNSNGEQTNTIEIPSTTSANKCGNPWDRVGRYHVQKTFEFLKTSS